jgi:hypothetical protein
MKPRRSAVWISIGLAQLLLAASPARAVEYRLLVASVFDTALTSFVTVKELDYGATGPGLVRLETGLDTGEIDWGAMPAGRPLTSVPESIARAWGGVAIRADIARGGISVGRWDEVRWQGSPGQRSIWVIWPIGANRPEAVSRVTLQGTDAVRLYPPYARTGTERLAVLQMPLPLIQFSENRGNVWDKWVGKGLDLSQGIGAVVGLNPNALYPDVLYLIVEQGDRPTTYRAVVSWSDRDIDREGRNNKMQMGNGRH